MWQVEVLSDSLMIESMQGLEKKWKLFFNLFFLSEDNGHFDHVLLTSAKQTLNYTWFG